MLESPIFYVNETILFFHDCRFETPEAKKNAASKIKTWIQGVPPPTHAQRLANRLNPPAATSLRSVGASTNSILNQDARSARTCAVVTSSSTTTTFLNKRSSRRQHVDYDDLKISERNVSLTAYGGLEDGDDSLEWLAALTSPLKGLAAVKLNKVSAVSALSHFV